MTTEFTDGYVPITDYSFIFSRENGLVSTVRYNTADTDYTPHELAGEIDGLFGRFDADRDYTVRPEDNGTVAVKTRFDVDDYPADALIQGVLSRTVYDLFDTLCTENADAAYEVLDDLLERSHPDNRSEVDE